MGRLVDLTNKTFGRLTVLHKAESVSGRTMWLCRCECGNIKAIEAYSLKIGETQSCGCLQREVQGNLARTHGLANTPLYRKFRRMHDRCYNTNSKSYKNYGGRGIKICAEWLKDFTQFYNWALQNGYSPELSIDRIDNNKGYSPENCRWVNKTVQSNNRRTNHFLEFNGERHTLAEWETITKISQDVIYARMVKLHWSVEKALATPVRAQGK